MKNDEFYMQIALHLASKAQDIDEVPIGCVVVKDDKIIAKSYNKREHSKDPTSHAEIDAIRKAAKKLGDWQLVKCTLYVTLEPCIMCSGAIIQSRIEKVVFGAFDPKGGGMGSSINVMDAQNINHKPLVVGGVLENECSQILKNYFKSKRMQKKSN